MKLLPGRRGSPYEQTDSHLAGTEVSYENALTTPKH